MSLDGWEQLDFIAVLAFELDDYLDTSPRFLDWPRLGKLVTEAAGDFKKLKVLMVEAANAASEDGASDA